MERWTVAVLGIAGLVFVGVGAAHLIDPQGAIAPMGLQLTEINSYNEIRANYGGMHLMLGLLFLTALWRKSLRTDALLVLALFTNGLVLGRAVSIIVDGNPGLFIWGFLVLEAVGAMAAFWLWRGMMRGARA